MTKVLRLFLVSIFVSTLALAQVQNATIVDENTTKAAEKLITELQETPVVIEKKKEAKKIHKSYTLIQEELDVELVKIENAMIDLRIVIADSIVNKTQEKDVLAQLEAIKATDFSEKYLSDVENIKDVKKKEQFLATIKTIQDKYKAFAGLKESVIQKYQNTAQLKETVIANTPIERSLNALNTKFEKYNKYFQVVGLDSGRAIIFTASMLGFLILAYMLNFLITKILTYYASKSDNDDLEDNNFGSIKTPIILLSLLIGFQVGLEIILYPSTMSENLALTFIIANTLTALVIFNKVVDIGLYILNHKDILKIKRSEILNLITRIIKIIAVIVVTAYLLTKFGVDPKSIVGTLGVSGLVFALAAKDMIAKFFDGIKLVIDDTFSIGDWIAFPEKGTQGTVIDVGFMNTKIRTFDNALLVIPNSTIASSPYINWSRRKIGRKLGFTVGVKYDSKRQDIDNALKELREMLENHPKISPSERDFSKKRMKDGKMVSYGDDLGMKNTLMVHLSEFAGSSINIDIYAFSKTVVWAEWRETKEDVMFKIMEILENNNLDFAFPSQSIYIENDPTALIANKN